MLLLACQRRGHRYGAHAKCRAMEEIQPEPKRLNLAGLAKCALIASFLLALAVWWCVPDADSSQLALKHAPPPPPPLG